MKRNPSTQAFPFLIGATPDHEALGWGRYVIVILFVGLLAASLLLGRTN